MVVPVQRHDVEDHSAIGLRQVVEVESELADAAQVLVVAVDPDQARVQVAQCAERDDVVALCERTSIESPGHEVSPRAFGEQQAVLHGDAGGASHERIGELDPTVRCAVAEAAAVAVHPRAAHAVEFDDPLLESRFVGRVGGLDLVGRGIERHDRLGPRATGTGAHVNQLLERRA